MKNSFKRFLPLIIIFTAVISLTIIKQAYFGSFQLLPTMLDFMGFFFLIFSLFKIFNLNKFAEAYAEYDIIAKRSRAYALIYPFIELTLGILYLTRTYLSLANYLTLVIMAISSIGVAQELTKGRMINCACLGALFKIPMTYVTLFEDILMVLMALFMILKS